MELPLTQILCLLTLVRTISEWQQQANASFHCDKSRTIESRLDSMHQCRWTAIGSLWHESLFARSFVFGECLVFVCWRFEKGTRAVRRHMSFLIVFKFNFALCLHATDKWRQTAYSSIIITKPQVRECGLPSSHSWRQLLPLDACPNKMSNTCINTHTHTHSHINLHCPRLML